MNGDYQRWKEQFETERVRLLEALSNVTEGGVIEAIQHVGATSVPDLHGSSCIDIGLAVWPFPLQADSLSKLQALGYHPMPGYEMEPEQRFLHESNSYQLFLTEPGSTQWSDRVLIRDYLRHDRAAREELSLRKQDPVGDSARYFESLLPSAHQWWVSHNKFSPVEAVVSELKDASFLWYISSGWALDLFLGQVNRVHHDVDVVVSRSAQMKLQRHLTGRGWALVTPFENRLELWLPDMPLELPRHQVHAHRGDDFIDFLLTEIDEMWIYRREPAVIRSLEKMGLSTEGGIPYLAPELVLLFKSKNTSNRERTNDQLDFERSLPHLDSERRAWLHWALIATSPDHPWIKQLI